MESPLPGGRSRSLGAQRAEPIQGFHQDLRSLAVGPPQCLVAYTRVVAQGLLRDGDDPGSAGEVSVCSERIRIVRHRAKINGEEVGPLGLRRREAKLTNARREETGGGALTALREAERLLDESLAQSRPRFFGYVGSSGLEVGVLAEALSASHDVNLASLAAAATMVEHQTIGWVGEFVGFGRVGGVVTSGGMVSNLTALAVARERALPGSRRTGLDGRGTLYVSAEAHSSIDRSAELLGIGSESVRAIPIDAHRRMDVTALDTQIGADLAEGRVPIAVVATAGTTLTGAVDPLAQIAAICQQRGVWFHVDGAYGLPAAATESAGHLFAGIELADSATIDAHKWLYVPKACGILLVRDPDALRRTFAHDASYMVDAAENPVDRTLEYSRPFRSLKLWTAFRAHGAEGFRSALEANLTVARGLADRVRAHPDLELVVDPQLSIVPFRHVPARGSIDAHNAELARRMQQ